MKRISLFNILILFTCVCFSQSISVSSFKLLESDLTANTTGTIEKDQNGEVAALIKVVTTQAGFTFDGGALGIVKAKQTPGEIWVYIPHGAKKITIKHPQLGVLRDYYFPCAIESARTYEMILATGMVQTIIKQERSSQYVVFQLDPTNSVVEVNGELLETVDGTAIKLLSFGTYDYRVKAPNHDQEVGKITISDPHNKHIVNVRLKSNLINVTIKADNDAEIWVNGEKKGTGIWTGGMGAGFYEMEARKAGYRSTISTHEIANSNEPHTIELQSPTPMYGDVEIESKPAMADIYIDDQKVGKTPQLLDNILAGNHTVLIRKEGYVVSSSPIIVKENETTKLAVTLEKLEKINNSSIVTYEDTELYQSLVNAGNTSLTNTNYTKSMINGEGAFLYNGLYYSVISQERKSVAVVKPKKAKYKESSYSIPSQVIYGNDIYIVTEIAPSAFFNCSHLKEIELPETLEAINAMAFAGCNRLDHIKFPRNLRYIGQMAFLYCNITELILPDSIEELADEAFLLCKDRAMVGHTKMGKLYVPDGIKKIGKQAFSGFKNGLGYHWTAKFSIQNLPRWITSKTVKEYGIHEDSYEEYEKTKK